MAHAATTSLMYLQPQPGETAVVAQFDVIYAGSDLAEGNRLVGLHIDVDPTNDTPNSIKNKITTAVRETADLLTNSQGTSGVTIGPNAILVGTDFSKG